MPKEIAGQKVYTLEEVARESGIPETTLRLYAREGRIRSRKIGKAWHITEEALKEFLLGEVGGAGTEIAQPGADHPLSMVGQLTGVEQAAQKPRLSLDPSPQARLSGISARRTLCHIDEVAIIVTLVDRTVSLELASVRAERLYKLLHRGPVRLESPQGVQAEVARPLALGRLRQEGDQWIFQIPMGQLTEIDPHDASLFIAGRLIRLVR